MSTSSGREVVSSSDEGFAEDLHSNNSDSSPQTLLDSLSPASRDAFDAINVVVRVKPSSEKEDSDSSSKPIKHMRSGSSGYGNNNGNRDNDPNGQEHELFPAAGQIQISDPQSGSLKSFTFDVIFEPEASQEQVFEHSRLKKFIDMSLEGFASTIFAYGQTGSGKTYTMFGNVFEERRLIDNDKQSDASEGDNHNNQRNKKSFFGKNSTAKQKAANTEVVGIVQFTFAYLWEQIHARSPDVKYIVTASFLEIYNEHVFDLLNPTTKCLQVRWSKDRGFYAENLFKVECEDLQDLEGVLREGLKNRAVRSHEMNQSSSRSHSLLTISLSSETKDPEDPAGYIRRDGRICLVDLAGSEKTKRTQSKGDTLVEANNINKSLLVLGTCIHSLSSSKSGHTPYRDSILTKLLADSLSGSGMTLMIACVSCAPEDANETINTLRYASRAKKVKTHPIVRMDPRELSILSLKREVRLLRMENHFLRQQLNMGTGSLVTPIDNVLPSTGPSGGIAVADRQMMQQYMRENESLRSENSRLLLERDQLIHDQEESDRTLVRMERSLQEVRKNNHHSGDDMPVSSYPSSSSSSVVSTSNVKPSRIPQKNENKNHNRSRSRDDARRPSLVGWDGGGKSLEVTGSTVLSASSRSKSTGRGKK